MVNFPPINTLVKSERLKMTELLTPHGIKETIGLILKLAFCIVFYFGISDKLGTGFAITPIIVLTLLAIYWKFVRHRFDK